MKYFIIVVLLIACKGNSGKIFQKKDNVKIQFSEKYKVCDTCLSTILVHHDECTSCGDITVDSGNVYLTKEILEKATKLVYETENKDSFVVSPNDISMKELFFADETEFDKLWGNTPENRDFKKRFKLTGKIVDVKRRKFENGDNEIFPSLFFRVDKFVEIKK